MKFITSTLVIIFSAYSCSLHANICLPNIVEAWESFASRHGTSQVPDIILESNCIAELGATAYFLPDDYTDNSNLDVNTDKAILLPASEKITTFQANYQEDIQASKEINSHQNRAINLNKKPKLSSQQNQLDEKIHYQKSTFTDIAIILIIKKSEKNPLLVILFFIMLLYCSYKLSKKLKTLNQRPTNKICNDCGSPVKVGRNQCFICGSYT